MTRLTEDEITALVSQAGVTWPVPLTTLDTTDEDSIGASVLRGLRSLLVRDLARPLAESGLELDADLLAAIRAVPDAEVQIQVSVGVPAAVVSDSRPVLSIFGPSVDGTWQSVTSSILGTVELTEIGLDQARTALVGLLQAAHDEGVKVPEGVVGPGLLYVWRRTQAHARLLVVSQGSVISGRVAVVDGEEKVVSDGPAIIWDESLIDSLLPR